MSTKTITVKIPWHNLVAVRDKLINEALAAGQDVVLVHDGAGMRIPHADLMRRVVQRTGPYADKFSNAKHFLLYYQWHRDVDTGQNKMDL